jgi:hypothetical protein
MATIWTSLSKADRFRILILKRGNGDELVRCTLVEHSFDNNCPAYFALSYTWGSTVLDHEIECDGIAVHVTKNLYSALKRLRSTHEDVCMWADVGLLSVIWN